VYNRRTVFSEIHGILRVALLGVAVLAGVSRAFAQAPPDEGQSQTPPTRAEFLRQQREAKAQALEPYEPNGLERAMAFGENRIVPLLQRDGIYFKLGSLTTGSGFAYGGGYRDRSFIAGRGTFDIWVAGSLKRYWAVKALAMYPLSKRDTVTIQGDVQRFGFPAEEFFGVGSDSRRADRSNFDLRGTRAGTELVVRPVQPLRFGSRLEYLRPLVRDGRNTRIPTVSTRFDPGSLPEFNVEANFLRTSGFAEVDTRRPINARKGGLYRVDVTHNADRDGGAFSFTRYDLDLRQFVSFLSERRIFAARMLLSTTEPADGATVPFYLMPWLGGNDTLRGFRAYRFRGPHAILLQGEYRWEIWSGLDAALFYDTGKVTLTRSDLDLNDLEHDYGFGFRFNTDNGIIMRFDAAFGSRDGRHFHIVFGGIF
jgi:surface antigen Omp85-like protein